MQAHPKGADRGRNPELQLNNDQDWQRLLALLPAPTELEESAKKTGALVRRRVVTSAPMLLRLTLVYALLYVSLADTATWAARALGVQLTDQALDYRFVHARDWLQYLVAQALAARVREQASAGVALRLIDATVLTEPGSKGTDWRLHLTYDPAAASIVGAELTDQHGGEHLSRAAGSAGDLFMGDMIYGHASDVREAKARQRECLLRVHLQSLAVADAHGQRLDPTALLDAADAGTYEHAVVLPERGYAPVAVRLVVVPLPPEQAGRARQRVRKEAKKKGKTPSELTLRLAGYLCCITTLTADKASVEALLAWYRVRWQVELLIKRCKSLLHLDKLAKARQELIALQVWARLLVAILVERMGALTRAADPTPSTLPPLSLWRLTRIHWLDVVLAVYGGSCLQHRLEAAAVTASHLHERSRRKRRWASELIASLISALGPPQGAG
jgi:Transposase DDE domain